MEIVLNCDFILFHFILFIKNTTFYGSNKADYCVDTIIIYWILYHFEIDALVAVYSYRISVAQHCRNKPLVCVCHSFPVAYLHPFHQATVDGTLLNQHY